MIYIFYFLLSLGLSLILTPLIKKLSAKFRVIDLPGKRKVHQTPTVLLGGVGIFLAFAISLLTYLWLSGPDFNIIPLKFFIAILLGGLVLIMGGILDDKYNLPPKVLWLFPALASLIAVAAGIGSGIKEISNPLGNPINLNYGFSLYTFHFTLSTLFVFLWLMGMIFTTKFLDGLDGLCAGISLIGGLTMFALSLAPHINQPMTASLAIIFSGSVLGFLFYNYNPATIFLGESGSTFLGFALGVLSVILGGKIATALLVMGIPILDVAWAITRRLWYGRSPFAADKLHLHHRLLDIGFSQRQTVGLLWLLSAFFGFSAVFLQTLGKLIALIILLCVMVFLAISAVIIYKRQHPHVPDLLDIIDKKP
jgi:UDP-GlcNAc:undecaprenyl-phosphate GlcNAc-1-phosphate transferase